MQFGKVVWVVAVLSGPGVLSAQFTLAGRSVQIHGFASQGFAYSSANNYLTMMTSRGSGALTDFGANLSVRLTGRLRIGAQLYVRNVGRLGDWSPMLDWAVADYRFTDWLGARAGRVKTTLGLFNDSQDNESLHTWALLPQSVYPLDLRGNDIAHNGADVYGWVSLRNAGRLEYTVYGGTRALDAHGGYALALPDYGFELQDQRGTVIGADLRWATPVRGLLAGVSHAKYTYEDTALGSASSFLPGLLHAKSNKNYRNAFYFDFAAGNLRLYGEYQRYWEDTNAFRDTPQGPVFVFGDFKDNRMWYIALTYRINKHLELGTYHSRFYGNWYRPHSSPDNHLFDQVVAARIDMNAHWDVKVEGHFMDGAPTGLAGSSLRGFYPAVNPNGFQPTTRLLVIRTGLVF